MYKLVVLDIDGTLVNSDKKVTEKTKEYIKKATAKGVKFIIASGRPPYGILPIAKEIELEKIGGYILAFNGGMCMNCENMEVLYETNMSSAEMPKIYEYAMKHNIPLMTYNKQTMYISSEETKYTQLEARLNSLTVVKSDDFVRDITFDFPKTLFTDEGEILEKHEPIVREMFPHLEVFRSEPFFLEVCPPNIHKATGIEKVIELLGVKQEEVIAIGDGFNDVTMIKYAGLGVAMGNAHDDIKAIANHVTLSNDEDGVAKVIEDFILNQ